MVKMLVAFLILCCCVVLCYTALREIKINIALGYLGKFILVGFVAASILTAVVVLF